MNSAEFGPQVLLRDCSINVGQTLAGLQRQHDESSVNEVNVLACNVADAATQALLNLGLSRKLYIAGQAPNMTWSLLGQSGLPIQFKAKERALCSVETIICSNAGC